MENRQEKNTGRYWMLFLVSLAIMAFMMVFVNSWFWVALPFVLTYFVQALDII